MEVVGSVPVAPGRALEIGCGTGTNAVWLAERGFTVTAVDFAETAISAARERAAGAGVSVEWAALDFLNDEIPGGPFDFVFDRGCFHVFDEADVQATFARRVADLLRPEGMWLSLIGSTEGPERDTGPPRRSARDVMAAVEPVLELVQLRAVSFAVTMEATPAAWRCLTRKRVVPAQPSTRR